MGKAKSSKWEPELHRSLAELYDRLYLESHAAPTGIPIAPLELRLGMPGDQLPSRDLSTEDRAKFAQWAGEPHKAVLVAAFGNTPAQDVDDSQVSPAVLGDGVTRPARMALLRLIKWDARYLYTATAYWAIRNAQLADDQEFMLAVGEALAANARYRGRHSREQKRLNNVLWAFTFGGRRSFVDRVYRQRVRRELFQAYWDADVPEEDPAWNALDNDKAFTRHARRMGLLDGGGP